MAAIGSRVGAIYSSTDGAVQFLGYGTYKGYQKPDPALGVHFYGRPMDHENPCIELDSGKLVFGCECWWGREETIKGHIAAAKVVEDVDIEEARRKA